MVVLQYIRIFCVLIVHSYVLAAVSENIGKLPHCIENGHNQGFVFVSTLDGRISTLNSSGVMLWHVDTGPGPLLNSNIHNVELTNNGEWIRIIPSLYGNLYKFNGKTVDAIPITADNLLKFSFFYSHDLVIAGGKEVRTYGIGLSSGNILYECSLHGCHNKTQFEEDNVIIIERNTQTVHAHEPRNGNERWNFSVGHHNLKIPSYSCINADKINLNFNISAVLPLGLLQAREKNSVIWEYKFDSPIVNIWTWNGDDLVELDMFDVATESNNINISPALYLAMHDKQLYIHESNKMLDIVESHVTPNRDVVESKSITVVPWKPVPAVSLQDTPKDHDKSTALSVLYNSAYINGNGYYLYLDGDLTEGRGLICSNNNTDNLSNSSNYTSSNFWYKWQHILLFTLLVALTLNIIVSYRPFGFNLVAIRNLSLTKSTENSETNISDTSVIQFNSRYSNDFETLCCLGRGGFGVVFQAKQKIDECVYAIKRITLPDEDYSRERVLREVKALATLDHQSIVRYFNSWVECPPDGWQLESEEKFMSEESSFSEVCTTNTESTHKSHKRSNSTVIDLSIVSFRNDSEMQLTSSICSEIKSSEDLQHKSDSNLTFKRVYLYIQMQLCKKESLKDWLFQNNKRPANVVIHIFNQIVDAVDYVHSKGLIHRDLKPSNIFFSMEGDIKVGDFGLVTAMHEDNEDHLNSHNAVLRSHTRGAGTQLYMSPEQINKKKYNFKVDIYSLGIILFELLVPFKTEMERICTLTDLRNNTYPENFSKEFYEQYKLLTMMLSINPDIRPTTAAIKQSSVLNPK